MPSTCMNGIGGIDEKGVLALCCMYGTCVYIWHTAVFSGAALSLWLGVITLWWWFVALDASSLASYIRTHISRTFQGTWLSHFSMKPLCACLCVCFRSLLNVDRFVPALSICLIDAFLPLGERDYQIALNSSLSSVRCCMQGISRETTCAACEVEGIMYICVSEVSA